jgi:uncharacterized membrane protein YeaQ/YmgE (transglycosylase-associated protein family)
MHFLIAFQDVIPDQTIRVEIQVSFLTQVFTWLIVGLVAGWLAGTIVRGRRMGFFGSLILGFAGAILGGVVYTSLNLQPSPLLASRIPIRWIDLLVAFCGALFLIFIVGAIFGFRRRPGD